MGIFKKLDKAAQFKKDLESAINAADLAMLEKTLQGMGDLSKSLLKDALIMAIKEDMVQTAGILLKYGAQPPSSIASRSMRFVVYEARMDMFRLLVSNGADFETQAETEDIDHKYFVLYKKNLSLMKQRLVQENGAQAQKPPEEQKPSETEALRQEISALKEELTALRTELQKTGALPPSKPPSKNGGLEL